MTPATGLTAAEVADRTRRGLVNRSRRAAWEDYLVIASRHVFTVFNFVVVPTAIALFLYGEWRAAISVSGTALANTVIGLWQEVRAKRQLDRLAILTARRARVVRDGHEQIIPADDLVVDDLVLLHAGDAVVADGVLATAHFLEIDEALLTGESDPVRRQPGERVLSGSVCLTGEGSYRADRIGDAAFAQSVTADARRYSYAASPLTRAANRIITVLSAVALALCGLYLLLMQLGHLTTERFLLMIAGTIVSMVPQGLVLTATVAFTLGAVVIGRRGALVQRLNAVEAMAAVDTICTDKTGTLTTNRLTLAALHPLDGLPEPDIRRRLALFATAAIDRENRTVLAIRAAVGVVEAEVIDQIPFTARTRFSAVHLRVAEAEFVLVLGAPETLVPAAGPWEPQLHRLRADGLRVLMFAEASGTLAAGELPDGLRPTALVALADELRPDAAEVLNSLAAQGIAFKAVSGDNPLTVRATLAPLDLPMAREEVVTGAEFADATDRVGFARRHSVFGRVEPAQKVAIVEALQAGGSNVAMIGDGVNDVLPIKKADLGIAMGEGSAAAKTVSSLVLQTNDFAVLPEAIAEGRTIVRNLRRAGKLFLTKNVYSLALILAYAVGLFDLPFPYLPQQVSLLNWMTIGIPALLIAFTRERGGQIERSSYLRDVGVFALRNGLTFAAAGLTLLALAKHVWLVDETAQRTMLLTLLILLGLGQLWQVFGGVGAKLKADRWLRALSLIIVPIYVAFMYWPFTADFFQMTVFGWSDWGRVLLVAVPAWAVSRLAQRIR